jgi:UDP-2,4-diacetamido-2,4,6-trideoxy-beta-L-altropyranose hydrolase
VRVAFRTDASLQIGSGHVMRCLTLADALVARGNECVFLCRILDGALDEVIRARGHRVEYLFGRGEPYSGEEPAPYHARWLECPWGDDARDTAAILDRVGAELLVVDHYALDARWEGRVADYGCPTMVIDDLADRPHQADLLLDQNLGRRESDYADLVVAGCRLLVGPGFALVGPRFATLRTESLVRRSASELERIMISMGGVDPHDATGRVLDCLARLPGAERFRVEVVMGAQAPHLDRVRAFAATMPGPTDVAVSVSDMPERMARADLAIGGAGGTAWERCALGLPTIAVVLAENQRSGAEALGRAGAALVIDSVDQIAERLPRHLESSADDRRRAEASAAAAAVVDGQGLERVCDAMEALR